MIGIDRLIILMLIGWTIVIGYSHMTLHEAFGQALKLQHDINHELAALHGIKLDDGHLDAR